jgi:hypothetical protein
MSTERPWTVYRTRFLVQARQLIEPLHFIDALGREHSGAAGDYLVESSDGLRRITPRRLFEDIYVPIENSSAPFLQSGNLCQSRSPGMLAPHAPPQRIPASA